MGQQKFLCRFGITAADAGKSPIRREIKEILKEGGGLDQYDGLVFYRSANLLEISLVAEEKIMTAAVNKMQKEFAKRAGKVTVLKNGPPEHEHEINGVKWSAADNSVRSKLAQQGFQGSDVTVGVPSVTEAESDANSAASLERIRQRNLLKELDNRLEKERIIWYNVLQGVGKEFEMTEKHKNKQAYVDELVEKGTAALGLSVDGRKILP